MMYCPNCKSANVLYNEDFDEYYFVCNYYFALEIPTEAETPESQAQDEERHELELLIL